MSIYLDYNATTPLAEEVIEAIQHALVNAWGNPSSNYFSGVQAKNIVQDARRDVAACISASDEDIVFTSGGSESNNWAVNIAIQQFMTISQEANGMPLILPHVITSTVEHDSILAPLENLVCEGKIELTKVPIDQKKGEVTADTVVAAIQPNTCLVTIMMANNETGTIMPIKEIVSGVRSQEKTKQHILIHTDAAQTIGKIPVNVKELDVDFLTIVGHKFYGPRIGALYIKDLEIHRSRIKPLIFGGGQERGFRAGTENTPMIAGLGAAAKLVSNNLSDYHKTMKNSRDYLERRLLEEFGQTNVCINGASSSRLPNTCNLSILGKRFKGYEILQKTKVFTCSTGSSCHSKEMKPSKILTCFHIPDERAATAIRISTGRSTSVNDIDSVVEELSRLLCF